MEAFTLVSLLKYGWSPFVAWYIFNYNKHKDDRKELTKSIDLLNTKVHTLELAKTEFVTHSQMKEAILEALEPYKEDQHEIKILLRALNDQINSLSKDMAVQDALRQLGNDVKNQGGG
jgi:hypothetical protein